MENPPILIIGKNCKIGARVDQRLQALGYETRGVSRATTPAFDWHDRSTWRNAMAGVRVAYVTYQPDLAVDGAAADMKAFMQIANEIGLNHIVLLSGRGEEGAERAEELHLMEYRPCQLVRSELQRKLYAGRHSSGRTGVTG